MSQPVPLNPGTDVTVEAKLNQLCEKCSSIADHVSMFRKSCSIDPDNPTVYWINHHESSIALITSARAGCHLCTLLLAKIEDAQAQELEFGIMDERSGRQAQLNYQIKLSEDFGSGFNGDFFIKTVVPIPAGFTRHQVAGDGTLNTNCLSISHLTATKTWRNFRQDPSVSTASPSSFAVARRWLRNCKEHHPNCRHKKLSVAGNARPTRLVDVGSLNEPATCQLFLPGEPSDRVEYLTLSHKWGGAIVYKLTKATLDSMLQGISLKDLPLTFQHAILITRNLGYRYLWIDSLCIIQDDVDDWAFESTTMSRIYSNSVLTIAALWGENSHTGCYVERNPLVTEDCYIGEWEHGEVLVQSNDNQRGESLRNVKPKPLLDRAWVLQERFLSPRTLYYGPWELLWECGEYSSCERNPGSTFSRNYDDSIKKRFRAMKNSPDVNLNKSHPKPEVRSIYNIWTDIRANYWSSRLSYHSDSLVAISGITTWIQVRTGLQFVFGLCKNFFLRELLWKVRSYCGTSRSTLSPTWSWASVKGAELTSPYDRWTDLKTPTFLTWLESIDDPFSMNKGHQLKDIRLYGPVLHGTLKRDKRGAPVIEDCQHRSFDCNPDIPLPDTIDVVCLVLVEAYWPDGHALDRHGLILVPTSCETSTYQRVGVWRHRRIIKGYKGLGDKLVESADLQSIRLV